MAFNINNFKKELKFGGARASLFEVNLSFPLLVPDTAAGVGLNAIDPLAASKKLTFMCKATTIPQSVITAIDVPYFGRKVKVAGTRNFEAWTITVINDEDFMIRKSFETWMAAINGHQSNIKNSGVVSTPSSYQTTASVSQYSKGPNSLPIRTYKFINVFPTELAAIEVSWDNENTIEEFTVTLNYDYWEIDNADVVLP
jgi:hypothetical protein